MPGEGTIDGEVSKCVDVKLGLISTMEVGVGVCGVCLFLLLSLVVLVVSSRLIFILAYLYDGSNSNIYLQFVHFF